MIFSKEQRRVVKSKPYIYNIIKGVKGTGKTTAALQRALYLKNQYSLYDNDRILFIVNENEIKSIKTLYENSKYKAALEYGTLFSLAGEDIEIVSLNSNLKPSFKFYSHIIVDKAEDLNEENFNLLEAMLAKKDYATLTFIVNLEDAKEHSIIVKKKRLNLKYFKKKPKVIIFKEKFSQTLVENEKIQETKFIESNNYKEEGNSNIMDKQNKNFLETYEYIDVRHGRKLEIIKNYGVSTEIMVKDELSQEEYKEEELRTLPLYSDIAAGEPILINDELEGNFKLPSYWFKGIKECFMLKVKGDSMIGANINHGDYVIIRKQYTAQNKDIVAVDLDGSATLKRLSLEKNKAVLMPENPKYQPINLDEDASIIGIAVGIIKEKF